MSARYRGPIPQKPKAANASLRIISELSFDFKADPLAVDRLEWVGDAYLQEIVRSLVCRAVIAAVDAVEDNASRRAAIRRNVTEFVGIAVSNEVLSLAFDQIGLWFASPQVVNGMIQQKLKTKADMVEACIGKLVTAYVARASGGHASSNGAAASAQRSLVQTVDELITIILQVAAAHLQLPQVSSSAQLSTTSPQLPETQLREKLAENGAGSLSKELESALGSYVGSSVLRSVCSCGIYVAAGTRSTPAQMTYMRQDLLRIAGNCCASVRGMVKCSD